MCSVAAFTASSGVLPFSRATMYAAYQPDQWCFGAVGSYWPWCSSASRQKISQCLDVVHGWAPCQSLGSRYRPGRRCVTSWSNQPLPSGSLNEANEP